MSRNHFPRRGDKVNDSRRIPHANGTIIKLLWSDDGLEEIIVKYDNETVFYDADEFVMKWTDRYGGAFILDEEKLS